MMLNYEKQIFCLTPTYGTACHLNTRKLLGVCPRKKFPVHMESDCSLLSSHKPASGSHSKEVPFHEISKEKKPTFCYMNNTNYEFRFFGGECVYVPARVHSIAKFLIEGCQMFIFCKFLILYIFYLSIIWCC